MLPFLGQELEQKKKIGTHPPSKRNNNINQSDPTANWTSMNLYKELIMMNVFSGTDPY